MNGHLEDPLAFFSSLLGGESRFTSLRATHSCNQPPLGNGRRRVASPHGRTAKQPEFIFDGNPSPTGRLSFDDPARLRRREWPAREVAMSEANVGVKRSWRVGRGFTLIELMVTVAIVAILATIAYPSYMMQMRKSRRAAAESVLMDIAQRQQQYLLDARSYAPDVATLNVAIPSDVSPFYTITFCQSAASACQAPGGSPPAFAAIATPIAGTAQAGDATLAIDNTGAKTPAAVW
jgi:type IV pilus assembly protein PilE